MRARQPIQEGYVGRGDVELFYEVFGEGVDCPPYRDQSSEPMPCP